MRDVHAVRTPENVVFEFERAGLSARALALIIDLLVMATLVGLVALTCAVFGVVLAGFARALYFVALFAIQWGYALVLEWRWHGQTVGKRVVGTRVLAKNGLAIGFGQAALRNLLRIVDILPGAYLLGGLCALFDAHGRRLGDIAADTVVVRATRATRLADLLAEDDRKPLPLQDEHMVFMVTAARALTAAERDVMLQLGARREQLPLPVRHELFAKLAQHVEQRLGVRRPEFLSHERFVLNIALGALPPLTKQRESRNPVE